VSRELTPGTAAVVTVGTIHGGTKRNISSDEVKLELTLRSYDDAVSEQLVAAIRRICDGMGRAAGLPEARLPVVTVGPERASTVVNEAMLTRRVATTLTEWMGPAGVKQSPPTTSSEDFSEYGRTVERVPICIWWVGATEAGRFAEAQRTGVAVPTPHSAMFAPEPEPTLKASMKSMSAVVLDLLAKK